MSMWHAIQKPILLIGLSPAWRRPRGHPQNLRLRQVNAASWELLGTGRELVWRLGRNNCQEWYHRIGEVTSPQHMPPMIDWLNQVGEVLNDLTPTHVKHFQYILHILKAIWLLSQWSLSEPFILCCQKLPFIQVLNPYWNIW